VGIIHTNVKNATFVLQFSFGRAGQGIKEVDFTLRYATEQVVKLAVLSALGLALMFFCEVSYYTQRAFS